MHFETENGKGIDVVVCPQTAHRKIQFSSGGELPAELTGLFTSENEAAKVITKYLSKPKTTRTTKTAK